MSLRLLHGASLMAYHHTLMPFAWSVFIDLSIFAAIYSRKPYMFSVHAITAFLTGFVSIATSFSSFMNGIPPPGDDMRFHKQLGSFMYLLIIVQICLGIVWWRIRTLKNGSKWTIWMKKIHTTLGYCLALVGKIQVLKILSPQENLFWFNLIWDIGVIVILVRNKLTKARLEQNPTLYTQKWSARPIKNMSQLPHAYKDTLIFGNFIFSSQELQSKHPAGYQVILDASGHCVDRYLYGMTGPQGRDLIGIKPHSHSGGSLQLLGSPLAELVVPQQYLNFSQRSNSVRLNSIEQICPRSNTYVLHLKLTNTQPLQYKGYSSLQQLGRYYSLTLDHQTTRLYTTVNFLSNANRKLMSRIFKIPQKGIFQELGEISSDDEVGVQRIRDTQQEVCIPLIVKKYRDGKMTKPLLQSEAKSLLLSSSKGTGLSLGGMRRGKIVMVAGGTGFLPFCDFIDLLFKQQYIKTHPQQRHAIVEKNKILSQEFMPENNFQLLLSVNMITQIHPIILNQLRYLAENSKRFQLSIRIKQQNQFFSSKIIKEHNGFEAALDELINKEQISNILVCGPSKMNRAMKQFFIRINFDDYLIL